jgi:predicted esterase
VAAGYSNGANIAASLLLLYPSVLGGAILFHPMVPLEPAQKPDLRAVPVFIGAGRSDPMVPPAETERLAAMLEGAGAGVTTFWQPGGHTLSGVEVEAARTWLASLRDAAR